MNYLSLLIDGQWAHLKEGTEISLEGNNPLFSDAGSKTYLFQLHVDSNRHLFGNSDEVFGDSYFDFIDGKDATLYVSGIPIISGVLSLEDEVCIDDDGCIAVNIVSGLLDFFDMIQNLNCRDVELIDEIPYGNMLESVSLKFRLNTEDYKKFIIEGQGIISGKDAENWTSSLNFELPYGLVDVTSQNVSDPYPDAKFCSIRRVWDANTKIPEGWRQLSAEKIGTERFTNEGGLFILGCKSLSTPPCMYILYFLDCLCKKLGISIKRNDLLNYEDARRIAFVNTSCSVKTSGWFPTNLCHLPLESRIIKGSNPAQWLHVGESKKIGGVIVEHEFFTNIAYLDSGNFPDVSVEDVIDVITSLFNVSFVYDKFGATLSIVSRKDVLSSSEYSIIYADVIQSKKVENKVKGFKLMYSSSDEEDTNYSTDRASLFTPVNSYADVISKVNSFEGRFFIDTRNGNAYAVKIDKEAEDEGDVKNLNPSLFEFGAFAPATYGDCTNDEYTDVVELDFTPIINNDVNGSYNMSSKMTEDYQIENKYALFIPDIENETVLSSISYSGYIPGFRAAFGEGVLNRDDSYWCNWRFEYLNILGELSYSEPPKINQHNVGLMLGVMRGPGNNAGFQFYDEDFDGEGNSRVAFTSANYAFTSDSIDNCNRVFDYNGDMDGGATEADLEGRISLKLRAGKFYKDGTQVTDDEGRPIPIDGSRANRGLYDKFWKEYAYFSVNKKIVRLRLRMEIAELVSLDWLRHYKIGDYVGLVSSWSVSVSSEGMSEVDIDLYYL